MAFDSKSKARLQHALSFFASLATILAACILTAAAFA
jgi:hypothetical protein